MSQVFILLMNGFSVFFAGDHFWEFGVVYSLLLRGWALLIPVTAMI